MSNSVKPALKPGRIGYVRITTFDENTPADAARRAGAAASSRPAEGWPGFVLDLRNDAGGLLDAVDRGRRRFSRFRDDRLDARPPTPTRTGYSRHRRTAT